MSKIELIGINKYYGDNHVLKDLTLTIEDGDFMEEPIKKYKRLTPNGMEIGRAHV